MPRTDFRNVVYEELARLTGRNQSELNDDLVLIRDLQVGPIHLDGVAIKMGKRLEITDAQSLTVKGLIDLLATS